MENLQTNEKYNFLKKFKFYALLGVLTVTTSLGALVSCGKKKHPTPSTPTPTTIDNPVSPTDIVTPTSEITVTPTGISVTPTATVTPEPTITVAPTVTPAPTPALADKNLSSADIWSKEFVETEYFDTNKPVEEQIEDRKELLESYDALNNNEVNVLVKCINKKATGEAMTQSEINELAAVVKKVYDHNQANPTEMIPLSQLGVDLSKEDKLIYNNVQCISHEMTNKIPANAGADEIYAYKESNIFMQLSYGGDMLLTPFTKDGDLKSSTYVNLKSLDPSCRVVIYLYALEALRPYKSASIMEIRYMNIENLLNEELENLKVAENPAPQLTK